MRFPIFVNQSVVLRNFNGRITLPEKFVTGGIKLGYGYVGVFDARFSRTIIELEGEIIFQGSASIGHGTRISLGEKGVLTIGNNFNITAEATIICFHRIVFGNHCLLSWRGTITDTDFHKIYHNGELSNPDRPITIGDNVWISSNVTILGGTSIGKGSVVAACSLVNKAFNAENVLLGGSPAKILKENISWEI